jgi:hypothetical protein
MHKVLIVSGCALAGLLAGCSHSGLNRNRPDELAVARQAPLVIPPDYSLVPPQPGAARPQDKAPSDQALDALYGGAAPRSLGENAALDAAGRTAVDPGIRSGVNANTPPTVDKGSTTRDIIAAPEGDGQSAKTATP